MDTPDEELDEEGLKEKKKQKLLKAGYDARERARKEKEREREAKEAEDKREEEERERDLEGWASKLRSEHEVCPSLLLASLLYWGRVFVDAVPASRRS